MKKILLPALMLALISFTGSDSTLTKAEREKAVNELTNSKNNLMSAIKGLSDAQLNFKSSPESWSVAECTEHLAISENSLFGLVEGCLKTTPDPSKRSDVKLSDEQLLAIIVDRSNKVKTREAFVPTGKYGTHKETIKEFKGKRKDHIKFVKKTEEDLRNRYQQLPFGTVDAYQLILFMSGHTDRHVLQIEEVKAHPDFPKN